MKHTMKDKSEYYDLMTAIMVCIGIRNDACENELLGLLDVLLSTDKSASEKKEILENEYHISMTEEMEGEMQQMCNLSDGVEQKGIEKGIKQGIEQNQRIVVNLIT